MSWKCDALSAIITKTTTLQVLVKPMEAYEKSKKRSNDTYWSADSQRNWKSNNRGLNIRNSRATKRLKNRHNVRFLLLGLVSERVPAFWMICLFKASSDRDFKKYFCDIYISFSLMWHCEEDPWSIHHGHGGSVNKYTVGLSIHNYMLLYMLHIVE